MTEEVTLRHLLSVSQVFWMKAARVPEGIQPIARKPIFLCAQNLGYLDKGIERDEQWSIAALQPHFIDAVGLPYEFVPRGNVVGRVHLTPNYQKETTIFTRDQMFDQMIKYYADDGRDPLHYRSDHFSREIERVKAGRLERARYGDYQRG